MGAGQSTNAVTPLLPESYSELTTEGVAAQVRALGEVYNSYADNILRDGMDGHFLKNEVSEADLPDIFRDLGVSSTLEQKKLAALFRTFKSTFDDGGDAPPRRSSGGKSSKKKFGGFLSHFKQECGTEARLVYDRLGQLHPDLNLFLDSDDLFDLRALLEDVKQSDCFILFQSAGVLTRPWCLMEIVTAINSAVPIVCINVLGPNKYEYSSALQFMTYLDTELDRANPGASKLLEDNGVSIEDAAYLLSNTIPNCISIEFNPHGSSNNITASLMDLKESLENASAHAIAIPKEEWLQKRGEAPVHGRHRGRKQKQHGSGEDSGTSDQKASVPDTVPELPEAFCVRNEDLVKLKTALLNAGGDGAGSSTTLTSKQKVGALGMVSNST